MDVNDFLPKHEEIEYIERFKFKKKYTISVGFTGVRYFLLESSKKNESFISSKELNTIAIMRKKLKLKFILGLFFLLIISFAMMFTMLPLGLAFLLITFLYLLGLIWFSRRRLLIIDIGGIICEYTTKRTNLETICEFIGFMHSLGNIHSD